MESVDRRKPWAVPAPASTGPLLDSRMARDQRPGRLRLRHGRRRATRRYHGLLDRRPAGAARPHMMLNHLSEQLRLPDGDLRPFGGEERADRARLHGPEYLTEFRWKPACPCGAIEVDGSSLEKRS